ncbi:hypothetical protein CDAR_457871 [Caerostris darwini]|uniref:G-protein coupled receptors family 3 profile domain-containing protein n=1 Tax=Caerostris darwini TaxID=1538125 RepID=A0AAV4V8T6_9ARAC|nr:hypothetical protein CDAR_457871 [Caerostris darwini]
MVTLCDVQKRTYLMCLAVWSACLALAVEGCLHCKQKPPKVYVLSPSSRADYIVASEDTDEASLDKLLDSIEIISTYSGTECANNPHQEVVVRLPIHLFDSLVQKIDLVSRVLEGYSTHHDEKMLQTVIEETVQCEEYTPSGRLLWVGNGTLRQPDFYVTVKNNVEKKTTLLTKLHNFILGEKVEWRIAAMDNPINTSIPRIGWTNPYYQCENKRWLLSYTKMMIGDLQDKNHGSENRLVGVLSVDVDVSGIDINQCDQLTVGENISLWQMSAFLGTHKCHNLTSKCVFTPGFGWSRGSYKCQCRDGFYSATGKPIFNGSLVESAYKDKMTLNSPTYDMLYVCKRCQPGCDVCEDDSPCLANYNWAFRISLLTISVICIFLTLLLSFYVYRYRKLKVINVASPIFLCITLLGCVIMYCEMAAIFPVLSMYSCIATKWTRHMGFCLTYSALLLKTWRVSLTYRVKSAHKLKLTDKQLLQWLFPILLVMAIYLGTWTISSPPEAVYIEDWERLKFKQCDYNWWDHSLAIGEFLFLLWGIRVCYNVRNAESVFNEAKHISWAVHSITIVNIIMVMIHLVILPTAGPDIKYLFGFVRTQLSTTVTVILIFGPKFYRVIKGQGDVWDNRARARGVTASFSLNGVGPVYEEPQDLYQENEELKEEVQKLASQIEFMKIVHMEVNNRHLKPKHGGFFSQTTTNQSPVIKNIYMKFDSTDSPGSRVSPAAELVSEKV